MKTLEVVAGIIIKNGKVLIAQKPINHKIIPNKWEFPGGKVEEGESHEAALARELLEEMKLKIKVQKFLAKYVHSYDGESEIHLHAYLCSPLNNVNALEHERIEWVNLNELSSYDLAFMDQQIVQNILGIKI